MLCSIITALGMVVLVPLLTWVLLSMLSHEKRIVAIEVWKGDEKVYSPRDAEKDFGVVIERININIDGIKENRLEIKNVQAYATRRTIPDNF